jgi:hydroxyethylthiazole kinase-like uncharacterized protein yjeF
MKILSVEQIRKADAFTIQYEPIASIDLMERASRGFVNWFCENIEQGNFKVKIFCGLGDNGADGLAIARMLQLLGYDLEVYVVKYSEKNSENFQTNQKRLERQLTINYIENEEFILDFDENDKIIDALLGSGLSRSVDGLLKSVIEQINRSEAYVIAVDMPSGLFADETNQLTDAIIKATNTIAFQLPKVAFLLAQNEEFVGNWHLVDIGLHYDFIENAETSYYFSTPKEVKKLIKSRQKFSHKGVFGHALLIAGSHGMMGAAVLAARACMRSGVGKLTVHSVKSGLPIMQTLLPEAMYWEAWNYKSVDFIATKFHADEFRNRYQAVGVGPGIGVNGSIRMSLEKLCEICQELAIPMVLDADALNNFSTEKGQLGMKKIPVNSILTPHPKEFKNLIGKFWKNDFEKLELLREFSISHKLIVCLKGANTAVALPDGTIHFNSSGNAGMATAGSGDVLTGIITALLAQGYTPQESAILGVYQHGVAGDRAAQKYGLTSMIASDIVENIRF